MNEALNITLDIFSGVLFGVGITVLAIFLIWLWALIVGAIDHHIDSNFVTIVSAVILAAVFIFIFIFVSVFMFNSLII